MVPRGSPERFHRDNFFRGGGGGVLKAAERPGQVLISQSSPFCGKAKGGFKFSVHAFTSQ